MEQQAIIRLNKLKDNIILLNEELKTLKIPHNLNIPGLIYGIDFLLAGRVQELNYKRTCFVCGKEFATDRKNTVVCSALCRRKRDLERYKANRKRQLKLIHHR